MGDQSESEALIAKWRAEGHSIIECIKRLRDLQGITLNEAKQIVHFSKAWADMRAYHDKLHEEAEIALRSIVKDNSN